MHFIFERWYPGLIDWLRLIWTLTNQGDGQAPTVWNSARANARLFTWNGTALDVGAGWGMRGQRATPQKGTSAYCMILWRSSIQLKVCLAIIFLQWMAPSNHSGWEICLSFFSSTRVRDIQMLSKKWCLLSEVLVQAWADSWHLHVASHGTAVGNFLLEGCGLYFLHR